MADRSEDAQPLVVHLWCGPRTLSTATMYSFAQRPDTSVVDEPLYAAYLRKHPRIFRPYRDQLLEHGTCDGNDVLEKMPDIANGKGIIVAKHMAKHVDCIDKALLIGCNVKNVIIVRDPFDMILSWDVKQGVHQEGNTLEATSLPHMVQIYSEIRRLSGVPPIVVDSNLLKKHPKEILSLLCEKLAIPFCESQLQWTAGPKPEIDGLWAPYWYEHVHRSTGFEPSSRVDPAAPHPTLSAEQIEVYREALPFFDLIRRHAIGVDSLCPGSSLPPVLLSSGLTGIGGATEVVDHGVKMKGSELGDPRNGNLLIWVGDRLLPRELAKVSVFDSAVQGGDAVWEGLRVYDGRVFKLTEHLHRLIDSAKAMAFKNVPSLEFIQTAVFRTLAANGMRDGAHMRLTLSRGAKLTSSMNPVFNVFGCNLLIVPEWKPVGDAATYDNQAGISLITATNRRNPPQCVDSKIHHCNLINNILPKIQANLAGAADALMLDSEGFVSETNATNVFMVKDGVVATPHADYCLPGITRRTIMQLVPTLGLALQERRISLAEFHSADEVFTTGTMGELTPVYMIDGRKIGPGIYEEDEMPSIPGPILKQIQVAFREVTQVEGVPLPL